MATIPVSLLIAVGVRRVQRALATEDLVTNGQSADATRLLRSLRRAMGDPRLDVAVFSKEAGEYLGADGSPPAEIGLGRQAFFIPASDGSPLARVDIDARLEDRPDLTESIFHAASLGLETVRLRTELAVRARDEATVRAQLEAATAEGAALSRLLPSGLPEKLRSDPGALGRIDEVEVTVLMSDVRGYTTISERTPPERLARQLQQHRAAMNAAVLAQGGTIMQYVGDAVMAVFGAPFPLDGHASRGIAAAAAMHEAQEAVNAKWRVAGWEPFGLGIGLSTGPVATAVLGSADRYEYTIVGDTVNLAQRLEAQARPAGTTIASAATIEQADTADGYEELPPMTVKGRKGLTRAFRCSPADVSDERSVTATVGVR